MARTRRIFPRPSPPVSLSSGGEKFILRDVAVDEVGTASMEPTEWRGRDDGAIEDIRGARVVRASEGTAVKQVTEEGEPVKNRSNAATAEQ